MSAPEPVQASTAANDGDPRPTRIVAVRHGETAWNVEARIQGQIDVELNAHGRWQAARLAEALVEDGLSAIYSSDLQRALETAAYIGRACGLPIVGNPGLRERSFGKFEGLRWGEIEERWPSESARWRARDPDFKPEGGESLPAFSSRVMTSCCRLAAAHPGESIAWVAHGGVIDCLHRAAMHLELSVPRAWMLANATVNRLLFAGSGFSIVCWGDASHLDLALGGSAALANKPSADTSVPR